MCTITECRGRALTSFILIDGIGQSIDRFYVEVVSRLILKGREGG